MAVPLSDVSLSRQHRGKARFGLQRFNFGAQEAVGVLLWYSTGWQTGFSAIAAAFVEWQPLTTINGTKARYAIPNSTGSEIRPCESLINIV